MDSTETFVEILNQMHNGNIKVELIDKGIRKFSTIIDIR